MIDEIFTSEKRCFYCKEIFSEILKFSCGHKICNNCCIRRIFCYQINEIQNIEKLTMKCKCELSGILNLSIDELIRIINEKNKKDIEIEKLKKKKNYQLNEVCIFHKGNIKNYFCLDCSQIICKECKETKSHEFHRIILSSKIKEPILRNLKEISIKFPNKEIFMKNFDSLGKKLKESSENIFNNNINLINEALNSLIKFKEKYENNFKKDLSNCAKCMKLLNLFYLNFYSELISSKETNDINMLIYLNNIKNELIDIEIKSSIITDQKIKELISSISKIQNFSDNNLLIKFNYSKVSQNYKCEDIIQKAHNNLITGLIQINDYNIITSSLDGSIKIWKEEKEKNTFNLQKGIIINPIYSINKFLNSDYFISCSGKENSLGHIDIFKFNDNELELIQSLNNENFHKSEITVITIFNDEKIGTGSKDGIIILWKRKNNIYEKFQIINEEKEEISSIYSLKDNRLMYSIKNDNDSSIRIWNINKNLITFKEKENKYLYNFEQLLVGHKKTVNSIYQLLNGNIVSGGNDNLLIIWKDFGRQIKAIQKLKGHLSGINYISQLIDNRIISSSNDKTIRIWKKDSNGNYFENEVLFDYNHEMLKVIQLKDGRLCSISIDNSIILWRKRMGLYSE